MADTSTTQATSSDSQLMSLMLQYEQLYSRYMQGDTSVGPQLNQLAQQMGTMSGGSVAAQTPPDPNGNPPPGASPGAITGAMSGTGQSAADTTGSMGGVLDQTGSGNLANTYSPGGLPGSTSVIDPTTGLPVDPSTGLPIGAPPPGSTPDSTIPPSGEQTVTGGAPPPGAPIGNTQGGGAPPGSIPMGGNPAGFGPPPGAYPTNPYGTPGPAPGMPGYSGPGGPAYNGPSGPGNPGMGAPPTMPGGPPPFAFPPVGTGGAVQYPNGATQYPYPGGASNPANLGNSAWGPGGIGTAAGAPSDALNPDQIRALQNATAPPPNPWDQAQQSGGMGGGIPGMGGGAPGLPALAPPPGGNAGNFLGSAVKSFQDAQNAANAANAAMYGNIQSGYNQLGSNLAAANSGLAGLYGQRTSDFASGANNVLGNYGNLLNSQTQGYGNIQNNQANALSNIGQGYTSMLGTALNNLNLLGATEGTDLNEQFQREAANAQQSLVDRGLNNTTVTDAVQRGIGLDKARALTNLAQGVNAQTNQTLSQFGNPALQFGQQAIAANTGLGTTALQNENQIAQAGLGAAQNFLPQIAGLQGEALNFGNTAQQQQTQLGQNQLNFMQGVNQTGPDYNTLAQLMMAAGAAGTGYGQNGFANLPNLPGQNPVGPLPGANLSNPNLQTQAQPAAQTNPYSVYIQALQQAQRQPAAGAFNMFPTAA